MLKNQAQTSTEPAHPSALGCCYSWDVSAIVCAPAPAGKPSPSAENTPQELVTGHLLCAWRSSLRARRPKLACVKGYFSRKEH